MPDESSPVSAPTAERRVGTALLSLQLCSAERLAAEAESTAIDRAAARAELRARLAKLVQRRRQDLDEALSTAKGEAAAAVSAAEQEAKVIVEAAMLMAQAPLSQRAIAEVPAAPAVPVVPAVAAVPAMSATDALPTRAAVALLTMQLRAAEQLALEADDAEATAQQQHSARLLQVQQVEQRREALDAELQRARSDAANLIAAAHAEAASAAPLPLLLTDNSVPLSGPTTAAPINVVIDAEAFARVFAAAFSSLLDQRLATGGTVYSQPMYPPMYAQLPAAPAVVKQSFWSHARHLDVLLLSGAMVIVLIVLAAWLA